MPERIVLVTAGGAIASFHAAMKQMHETLEHNAPGRFELLGARGGLSGLIEGDLFHIRYEHLEEDKAGSLLGADRKIADTDKIAKAIRQNKVYAVVMMGGNNHLGEADRCHDIGLRVVGYPKTMDGDLSSHITLGWETAITLGATQTRNHHSTAMTHRRVFYVGLFGRDTDWVICGVTAYGGADLGIPSEKEYDLDFILEKVESAVNINKEMYGLDFAVVPYSEGTSINGINAPPDEHNSIDAHCLPKLQSEWVGMELVRLTKGRGIGAAFQAHTYDMRDSPPTETDKTLSRMAGAECMRMVIDGDFGKSAVFVPENDFYAVGRAPLQEVAVQRKVSPTGFFDYDNLRVNQGFIDTYANLFRQSLGNAPAKDQLVYKNMLEAWKT